MINKKTSPQSYCLEQNFKYVAWFWCSKQSRFFKNVFMIRRFIHFCHSLNIVLFLDTGCEFFCAKCVRFPLMINLVKKKKSKFIEAMYYFVNKRNTLRFAHVLCNFISLYLIVLTFAMRLKNANNKSHWNTVVFYYDQWK